VEGVEGHGGISVFCLGDEYDQGVDSFYMRIALLFRGHTSP
jgi:hypothetical protein